MFSPPANDLDGICAVLDDLAGVSFADQPVGALHEQATAWSQAMSRLQAVGAGLLGAWDAQDAWVDDGATSGAAWLRNYGELAGAARWLKVARRLRRLPLTEAALRSGVLSFTKVEILVGAVDDTLVEAYVECEQVLVETAQKLSVSQTTTLVRRWRAAAENTLDDVDRADLQRQGRSLRIYETLEGMIHLEGTLDPETGAIVKALLEAREQELFRTDINTARAEQGLAPLGDDDEPASGGLPLERTPTQRRADSLADLLHLGADRDVDDQRVGGPSSELHLSVGLGTLIEAGVQRTQRMLAIPGYQPTTIAFDATPLIERLAGSVGCDHRAGFEHAIGDAVNTAIDQALHPDGILDDHDHPADLTLIDLLACDTRITRIVCDRAGVPIDVGRTQRLATRAQRRELRRRDGGCAFPDCDRKPAWCDAHHIIPWQVGGPTNINNLVLLCRRHHTMMHTKHPWVIHIDPTSRLPVITRPDGTPARPPGLPTPPRRNRGRPPDPPPPKPPDPDFGPAA